jgi:hypothetical protein
MPLEGLKRDRKQPDRIVMNMGRATDNYGSAVASDSSKAGSSAQPVRKKIRFAEDTAPSSTERITTLTFTASSRVTIVSRAQMPVKTGVELYTRDVAIAAANFRLRSIAPNADQFPLSQTLESYLSLLMDKNHYEDILFEEVRVARSAYDQSNLNTMEFFAQYFEELAKSYNEATHKRLATEVAISELVNKSLDSLKQETLSGAVDFYACLSTSVIFSRELVERRVQLSVTQRQCLMAFKGRVDGKHNYHKVLIEAALRRYLHVCGHLQLTAEYIKPMLNQLITRAALNPWQKLWNDIYAAHQVMYGSNFSTNDAVAFFKGHNNRLYYDCMDLEEANCVRNLEACQQLHNLSVYYKQSMNSNNFRAGMPADMSVYVPTNLVDCLLAPKYRS